MTVAAYPEFFNDVFGPVMQPGSSSHFAGPCRLGYLVSGSSEFLTECVVVFVASVPGTAAAGDLVNDSGGWSVTLPRLATRRLRFETGSTKRGSSCRTGRG